MNPSGPGPKRVYSRLLEPAEHPDYRRRAVRPPDWATFGFRPQFTCLRSFEVRDGRLVGFAEELARYTREHRLGRVIWPSYQVLFAANLGELAEAIAREELFLFDIWGYVPGSGPGGYWTQFKAPPEALRLLEATLGPRWLGTDFGEQDGRYLNGYAAQMTPASAPRAEQYLHFQRHFERMGDDLGHRHAALVSLNFGHYLLKEGTFTLIGAETAQALPNSQVYYAFIRGAGKQYGVPWFGNASVFNRWGFKRYVTPGQTDGYPFGPTKGTSLSLLKRLLYTHLLYNSMIAGFETGWLEDSGLTPIGSLQQAAVRWTERHGMPGVMHTPVALLLDFHCGWSFPRHLYSEKIYRVWGNLPYGEGDYLTDAVLDLLYPGYQDASYFHDERGFNVATPFGDIADCLLSDAAGWLLARYPVVVVAGELSGGAELRDKLEAYVAGGGHLVITRANLAKLPGGLGGIADAPRDATVEFGRGRLTLLASPLGVRKSGIEGPLRSEIDRTLAKPYVLEPSVRETLTAVFQSQMLFVAGESLSLVCGRRGPGEYTVGIANNSWRELPLHLECRCGKIVAVEELPIETGERAAEGFLPEGTSAPDLGRNTATTIAGGDVRVFRVRVADEAVIEIGHQVPAPRPEGRLLTLRRATSIKEAVLSRPTFFEHFDGVLVDWRYVQEREISVLRAEAGWIGRQGLRVVADLTSGVDLYPGLRLVENDPAEHAASLATIEAVVTKLAALGGRDLLLSLHRAPENNYAAEETLASFERTLRRMADFAQSRQVTVHLRTGLGHSPYPAAQQAALVGRVGRPNLRSAPMLSRWMADQREGGGPGVPPATESDLWLVAACRFDHAGDCYDLHAPLAQMTPSDRQQAESWLAAARGRTVVFDALLGSLDDEYREVRALRSL